MNKQATAKQKREQSRLKQARYRAKKRYEGMVQINIWVPEDTKQILDETAYHSTLNLGSVIEMLAFPLRYSYKYLPNPPLKSVREEA
jgi:hypothetical protein